MYIVSLDNEQIMISTQGAKGKQNSDLTYFNLESKLLDRSLWKRLEQSLRGGALIVFNRELVVLELEASRL